MVNDMRVQMCSGEVNRCVQLTLKHIIKHDGFGRHRHRCVVKQVMCQQGGGFLAFHCDISSASSMLDNFHNKMCGVQADFGVSLGTRVEQMRKWRSWRSELPWMLNHPVTQVY